MCFTPLGNEMVLGSINCKSGQHVGYPFEANRVQIGSNAFFVDSYCVNMAAAMFVYNEGPCSWQRSSGGPHGRVRA